MGLLTPCSVPRGGILYIMIVPGMVFAPFKSCPRGGVVVLDEIDTCIIRFDEKLGQTINYIKIHLLYSNPL